MVDKGAPWKDNEWWVFGNMLEDRIQIQITKNVVDRWIESKLGLKIVQDLLILIWTYIGSKLLVIYVPFTLNWWFQGSQATERKIDYYQWKCQHEPTNRSFWNKKIRQIEDSRDREFRLWRYHHMMLSAYGIPTIAISEQSKPAVVFRDDPSAIYVGQVILSYNQNFQSRFLVDKWLNISIQIDAFSTESYKGIKIVINGTNDYQCWDAKEPDIFWVRHGESRTIRCNDIMSQLSVKQKAKCGDSDSKITIPYKFGIDFEIIYQPNVFDIEYSDNDDYEIIHEPNLWDFDYGDIESDDSGDMPDLQEALH